MEGCAAHASNYKIVSVLHAFLPLLNLGQMLSGLSADVEHQCLLAIVVILQRLATRFHIHLLATFRIHIDEASDHLSLRQLILPFDPVLVALCSRYARLVVHSAECQRVILPLARHGRTCSVFPLVRRQVAANTGQNGRFRTLHG
jgi:hypothetical protein